LQYLKAGSADITLVVRFIRTPVRIIIICKGFSEKGYNSLLENFRKHRERLAIALVQKEDTSETTIDPNIESDLLESAIQAKQPPAAPANMKKEPASEINFEVDFDSEAYDPAIIAATMIVQGFDRIEFKRDFLEIELAVYL